MATSASDTSIRVAIRVRPLIRRENDCNCDEHWHGNDGTSISQYQDGKKLLNTTFTFDRVFGKESKTIDLYDDFAKPVVRAVMEGINGTLFAYGQTSSGKTFTMTGTPQSPGIILYALQDVFDYIADSKNQEFLLRVSFLEIYNDKLTDLLNPGQANLKIRENMNREISVENLTEEVVTSVDEVIRFMNVGQKNRRIGATNMNERSSRSHTIFRMIAESSPSSLHSCEPGEIGDAVKVSHLNLVDLAGSERASASGAEGLRLKEGSFINTSLFTLADVIYKLSDGDGGFIPYRNSKLTRILQNSLGGNAKTSIICAITPASIDETHTTLQFASRAKRIKNKPEVNEVLDDGTMLKRCRRQIKHLKHELEQTKGREESLQREMELQLEKEKIQQELEEQRKIAEETKIKLMKVTNILCTSKPNENDVKQRKQRRWTVCPSGTLRKPLMEMNFPFESKFVEPCRRLEQTFACSPSRGLDMDADFNMDNRRRFLEDILEKEVEVNAVPVATSAISCSVIETKRSSAENDEKEISSLQDEVKKCKEEKMKLLNELEQHDEKYKLLQIKEIGSLDKDIGKDGVEDLLKKSDIRCEETERKMGEEIEVLKDSLAAVISEKESMIIENKKLLIEIETCKSEMSLMKETLASCECMLKDSEACALKLEAECEKELKEKENLSSDLSEMTTELIQKQSDIEDLISSISSGVRLEEDLLKATINYEQTTAVLEETKKTLQDAQLTLEEKTKALQRLEGNLKTADIYSDEKETFLLNLKEKDALIDEKSSLIVKQTAELETLVESKKELIKKHELCEQRLKEEFDNQIEFIREAVNEKEKELSRIQQDEVNALLLKLQDKQEEGESNERERMRLNKLIEENTSQICELKDCVAEKTQKHEDIINENVELNERITQMESAMESLNDDLKVKESRIVDLESKLKTEIGSAAESDATDEKDTLVAEKDELQIELLRVQNELVCVREELRSKNEDVVESMNSKHKIEVDELNNQICDLKKDLESITLLKGDVEKELVLSRQKNELLNEMNEPETSDAVDENEMKNDSLETQSKEVSCPMCRVRDKAGTERRDSEIFKAILVDFKEQIGTDDVAKDKLVEELRHALIADQDVLEQKQFVLDEKEIEILAKDEAISRLETENADLMKKYELIIADSNDQITCFKEKEDEMKQNYLELERSLDELTVEKNALLEKINDGEIDINKERITSLNDELKVKCDRIAELEKQEMQLQLKEAKICELTMELDLQQSEITTLKGRCDMDTVTMTEMKQVLKEQEDHIGQLEACNGDLRLGRDDVEKRLKGVLEELEEAQKNLQGLENEKAHNAEVLKEKTEMLEEYKTLSQNLSRKLEANEEVADERMKNSSLDTEHHDDMVDVIGIGNLKDKHVSDEKRHLSLSDVIEYEKMICENAHLRASQEELTKEIAQLEQKRRENKKLNCENLKLNNENLNLNNENLKLNNENLKLNNENQKLNTGIKECEDVIQDLKTKCADFEDETKELKMQLKKSVTAVDDSVAKCLQLQRETVKELEEKYRLQIDEGNARNAELNNEVVKQSKIISKLNKEDYKLNKCLRECEDELQDLKFEYRDLQDEHEELKTSLGNTDGIPATTMVAVDKTSEIEILRAKIDALESDVERYRRAIGELEKTNKSFQERELELLNADREKTLHLDNAVKKIRALEKDVGMFARQSSELKAEIRALKNRDHECTFDVMHGEPASSSNGEPVGVVGSVAVFSLSARLERMKAEKKKVEAELAKVQKRGESLANENANVKKKNHEIECKLLKVMMAENIQKPEKVDIEAKHESSNDVATENGQQPAFGQIKSKKCEKDYFIVASQTSIKSREMNSDNFKQQKWNENENSVQGKPFLYQGEKSAFRPTESFLKAGSKLAGPVPSRMKTNNKMIGLEPRVDRNRSDGIQAIAKDRSALRSSNHVSRPARGFGSQEERGLNYLKHDPNNCKPQ